MFNFHSFSIKRNAGPLDADHGVHARTQSTSDEDDQRQRCERPARQSNKSERTGEFSAVRGHRAPANSGQRSQHRGVPHARRRAATPTSECDAHVSPPINVVTRACAACASPRPPRRHRPCAALTDRPCAALGVPIGDAPPARSVAASSQIGRDATQID